MLSQKGGIVTGRAGTDPHTRLRCLLCLQFCAEKGAKVIFRQAGTQGNNHKTHFYVTPNIYIWLGLPEVV